MSKNTVELDNGSRSEIDSGENYSVTKHSGLFSSLAEVAAELRKAADYIDGPVRPAAPAAEAPSRREREPIIETMSDLHKPSHG
jgi:hypothetical protein